MTLHYKHNIRTSVGKYKKKKCPRQRLAFLPVYKAYNK